MKTKLTISLIALLIVGSIVGLVINNHESKAMATVNGGVPNVDQFEIVATPTISVTLLAGQKIAIAGFTHNLGYVPAHLCYYKILGDIYFQQLPYFDGYDNINGTFNMFYSATVSTVGINIVVESAQTYATNQTYVFKCYLMRESAS